MLTLSPLSEPVTLFNYRQTGQAALEELNEACLLLEQELAGSLNCEMKSVGEGGPIAIMRAWCALR